MKNPILTLPFDGGPSHVWEPVGGFPPRGYQREMPAGVKAPVVRADLTDQLPVQLYEGGCQLLQIEEFGRGGDPFVLYDAWGHILAEWERSPSLGELLGFR